MNDIQIRLKEARKERGYTQKDMAVLLGITQQAYQKVEAGRTEDMRVSTLKNLCKILDVSADWVIGIDSTEAAKLKLSVKDLQVLRSRGIAARPTPRKKYGIKK